MATYRNLLLDVKGRIATVTLNRPENRNALDEDMIDDIVNVCREVQTNTAISAMIITGSGKSFCAGGNVKNMAKRLGDEAYTPMQVPISYREGIQRLPKTFLAMDVPVIAAINGAAVGAGCDLTFFSDIRIATPFARFGEVFIDLGLVPGDGGPWFIVRELGFQRAAYMTFTGRIVDINEAQELGIVHKVVEPDQLLPEANRIAEIIASKPPATLRITKRLLRHASRLELDTFLDMTGMAQALAHASEDHREALSARADNRKPKFVGR
jgi:enoyl-CoA hydratase/carnithine racemase